VLQHGNLDCWEEEEEEAESQSNRGSLIWRAAAAGECMHRVPEGVTQPAELKPTTIAHALLTAPFTARPSIGARMLAQVRSFQGCMSFRRRVECAAHATVVSWLGEAPLGLMHLK
jgi:hypothetical protein